MVLDRMRDGQRGRTSAQGRRFGPQRSIACAFWVTPGGDRPSDQMQTNYSIVTQSLSCAYDFFMARALD